MNQDSRSPLAIPSTAQPPRRSGSRKLLGVFFIVFLVFAGIGLYSVGRRRNERKVLADQTERATVPYVSVIHAAAGAGGPELVLPGTLSAYIESSIYARTNGYLKKWYKDIGARVKQGDLLAEIDTPEVDDQLTQARADLTTAQANLKLADTTAKRYQGLLETNSVSHQDVDNANGDYAAKQAMVQSADANVKRLEQMEAFKRVYAPFDGVVIRRNVDIGNLINAGNGGTSVKEMFDIAQIDPLRVYVSVPESNASSMHAGLKACLEMAEVTGRQVCGQVVRTANAIDPGTRTLLTEVDVPNHAGTLLPGAYAQVHFDVKASAQRLSVPANVLLFRPEGTMVAVVRDGRINLQKLTIGRDFGTTVEVLQGVSAADAIVINPPDSLEQNEKVAVREQSTGSAPTAAKR